MTLQAGISSHKLAKKVGQQLTVLIDEVDDEGAIGRSKADAPEIDGVVYLNDVQNVKAGQRVEVKITNSDEHDLWGELV